MKATNKEDLLQLLQFTIQVHDETFKQIIIKNANNNVENRKTVDRLILKIYTNSIQKIKSMYILADNEQYGGIGVIARSVIESMAYLDFILEDNSIDRAKALETSLEIREESNLKQVLKFYKTTNNQEMINYTGNLLKQLKNADFFERKKDYLKHTSDRYGKSDELGARFYSYKNKIYGFYKLCEYLDSTQNSTISYVKYYTFFYVFFSRDVHGLNLEELIFDGQAIDIEALRTKDMEKYLQIIFSISLDLNRLVCEKIFKSDYKEFTRGILETTGITFDLNS